MRATTSIAIQAESLPDEDVELILAAQKDPARFVEIYNRWAVPVYQYFFHRTGEMSSAEDLTSQLFLAAYQSLPRYRHRGHFPAWLFTIARNLAKEHYRTQGREVSLDIAQNLTSASNPPAEYTRTDEIRRLIRLVRSLPEEEQELIRLRYVAELSFANMAVVLNKREDAIKKSLYRLQDRLHTALLSGILLEQNHE